MKATLFTPCAMFVAILAAPSWLNADDLNPPPYRGDPLSTTAEWEFLTPNSPLQPDGNGPPAVVGDGNNGPSGGVPLATIVGPMQWDNQFDPDGVWIGVGQPGQTGQIILDIPNWIDQEPIKYLRIQLTVQQFTASDGTVVTPFVSGITAFDPTGPTTSARTNVVTMPIGNPVDQLFHRTEDWIILPNPDWETIVIDVPSDTLVDQIVVDTVSREIPEPTTMVLAWLLSVALLLRRRR